MLLRCYNQVGCYGDKFTELYGRQELTGGCCEFTEQAQFTRMRQFTGFARGRSYNKFAEQTKLTRQHQRRGFTRGHKHTKFAKEARRKKGHQVRARQACTRAPVAQVCVKAPANNNEGAALAKLCDRALRPEASSMCWRTWRPSPRMPAPEGANDN